jgi:cephalosporin hydroxylase
MSSIKKWIPAVIRDKLRPWYQTMSRRWGRYADRWRTAPVSLQSLRQQLQESSVHNDTERLYQIAQQEFGVLQLDQEIVPALNYISDSRPSVVGEIGLKHGGNSFLFTQRFRNVDRFIGIDLKLENTYKLQYLSPANLKINLVEGSSYAPATVEQVKRLLGRCQFDFLFIDADHSWHGAREDFLRYLPLVKPGGLVGIHDIVPDEVARFGKKQSASQCYGGDVYRLWALLKERFEHREFVASWDQIGFGIGILRLPPVALSTAERIELEKYLTLAG